MRPARGAGGGRGGAKEYLLITSLVRISELFVSCIEEGAMSL